jgi:predicted Zn-dependent peptidase
MKIETTKLSNGITVITSNQNNSKLIAVSATFKAGTADQKDNENGVAHLLEHMMFKGTKDKDENQILQEAEILGIDLNAHTQIETTSYYFSGFHENLTEGVDLLSDIICNSNFTKNNFLNEKNVVLSEISNDISDSTTYINDQIMSSQYKNQGLGKNILGSKRDIKNLQLNQVVSFWRQNYNTENLVVSCIGKIKHDEFCKLVEDKFKNLEKNDKYKKKKIEKKYEYSRNNILIKNDALDNTEFKIIFPFLLDKKNILNSESKIALFSSVLGGTRSSMLMNELRTNRSLLYSTDSVYDTYDLNRGHIEISGSTSNHLDEIIKLILDLFVNFEEKIDNKYLTIGKNFLIRSTIESENNILDLSLDLNHEYLKSGKLATPKMKIKEIKKITIEDLVETCKEILNYSYPTLILHGKIKNLDKNYYELIEKSIDKKTNNLKKLL